MADPTGDEFAATDSQSGPVDTGIKGAISDIQG